MSTTDSANAENAALIDDFLDEALSALRELPAKLEAFRADCDDEEPIHAVFRAVHSIKGCAGFLGLGPVKQFAHSLENHMDEVRKKTLVLTADLQRKLTEGFDYLEELLNAAGSSTLGAELEPRFAEFLEELAQMAGQCTQQEDPEEAILNTLLELAAELPSWNIPQARAWSERLEKLLPQDLLAAEEESGPAPTRPAFDAFELSTFTLAGQEVTPQILALTQVFLAVKAGKYTTELGAHLRTQLQAFVQLSEQHQQPAATAGFAEALKNFQIIVNGPIGIDADIMTVVWDSLWPVFNSLAVTAPQATAAPLDAGKQPAKAEKTDANKARVIRIREELLDDFIAQVSRLFITSELLKELQSRMGTTGELPGLVEEFRQITTTFGGQSKALQESVVALRRVAVGALLSKYPRVARTLATQLGKQIDVHLSGESTEIDKTLFESLDAPLTHMIRNVVDHGLEAPEGRRSRGVPETDNLWLHAENTRTHVRLIIRDDGRGIDPAKLRSKAVDKGVITAQQAQAMSDEEAIQLIFHPGFSTAEKVSEVSGRGVGMDVVRSTIQEFGGDVYVDSKVGLGTTFRLEIPIRDAVVVVDGLMVEQSGQRFVIAFDNLREIAELKRQQLLPLHGNKVANIRGETHVAVELSEILGIERFERDPEIDTPAVLVGTKQGTACLLVDKVLGHRQVVVNKLSDILPNSERITGVAQLGGGRLALVLSVADIIRGLSSADRPSDLGK